MHTKMPVLFIGHGSPMNAVMQNSFTDSLKQLTTRLPRPKAIMVISAHWLTRGTHVSCSHPPRIIHDFYGFPRELYDIAYPCPGAPQYAELVRALIPKTPIACDNSWGIDHAAWALLRHMYPSADIPVFELSLDYTKPPEYHYQLASELAPLRDHGVLCLGSGNLVHNLAMADFDNMDAAPYSWAQEFDAAVKRELVTGNHKHLVNYEHLSPSARLAVPTNEHYLPLLYAIALQGKGESINFIHEEIQNASVSMRSFIIGEQAISWAA